MAGGTGAEETIWAAVGVLRKLIESYGVPQALYTDWKNVYVREQTGKELLSGQAAVTQFGRMCERLGIAIIAASSPQAQGRVERNHGTHQDRLVKKLRRKAIGTHEEANQFLDDEYLPEHNRRFTIEAGSQEDFHTKRPAKRNWTKYSGWKRSGPSQMTGWCATAIACCRSSVRGGIMHRPRRR